MGFDRVCICKATAKPLGYLPLQQLPENQKDEEKQKERDIGFQCGEKCLLDEVSGIRSEVGRQVQFTLNCNVAKGVSTDLFRENIVGS